MVKGKAYPRVGTLPDSIRLGPSVFDAAEAAVQKQLPDRKITFSPIARCQIQEACASYRIAFDALTNREIDKELNVLAKAMQDAATALQGMMRDADSWPVYNSLMMKQGAPDTHVLLRNIYLLAGAATEARRQVRDGPILDDEQNYPGLEAFVRRLRGIFDQEFGHLVVRRRPLREQAQSRVFLEFLRSIIAALPSEMKPQGESALRNIAFRVNGTNSDPEATPTSASSNT